MSGEPKRGGSFDPRTWIDPETNEAAPLRRGETSVAPEPVDGKHRALIAAIAGLVILLIGAGVAWSQHGAPAAPSETPRPR